MAQVRSNIERLLPIVAAGMMVLATMLFSVGHRSRGLVWGATLLAVAAVYFADIRGRFHLGRQWASLLSLVAVVAWLVASLLVEGDRQLIAVTYVLLALQVILLFQPKSQRIYWQLVALSVAQAAVASALTPGLFFGFLLLAFTMLGILALGMLLMRRELARFGRAGLLVAPAASGLAPAFGGAGEAVAPMPRSPAGRASLQFVGTAADWPEAAWRRTLVRQAAAVTLCALAVTCAVFVLFPRLEHDDEGMDESLRSVGFSKEVTLGEESGSALQNPDVVMRVQLFDEPSGLPIQLIGEPLLRGAIATDYTRGRWRQGRSITTKPLESLGTDRFVRQWITIEPLDDAMLFSLMPAFRIDEDERLRIDYRGDAIVRRRSLRGQRIEFELATTGVRNRQQSKILPLNDFYGVRETLLLQMPAAGADGVDPLAGLRAAADRVKGQAQLADGDRLGLARALERHLRDSGQFQYTLDGQKRRENVDPIEDFVVEHRRGHCEYFAGALALMLRSQGIPARVAIGFRAGEWNLAGGYYQVRQLHAHTWVEAILEPQHFADESEAEQPAYAKGAWLVLDPTPSAADAGDDGLNTGVWARAAMYFDYLQVLWGKYVTSLDAKWQDEFIYQPLDNLLGSAGQNLLSGQAWRGWFGMLARRLVMPIEWYHRNWFSLPGALSAVGLLLGVVLLYRVRRPFIGWWRSRLRRSQVRPRAARRSNHEIYVRLERALARRGWVREVGQTPFEFALAAGGELAETIDHIPLSSLPRRVVEAFYRVRFGGRPLDNSELQAVEHALRALEERL